MPELPLTPAPMLNISHWYNCEKPLNLLQLREKVVAIFAFQMLCPACVSHSLPQAKRLHQYFSVEEVCVIGLHSVFEHHQAMNNRVLEAFIREYRLEFPIAVDTPATAGSIPQTMQRYQLQGTPSLLIIDRQGYLRVKAFGAVDDLPLGHWIGKLLNTTPDTLAEPPKGNSQKSCTADINATKTPG